MARLETAPDGGWFPLHSVVSGGLMWEGVRVGEGMHQAACPAQSACRQQTAWMPIETDAMRRVQAPSRACVYPTSSL